LLNSPNNPTGLVISLETLERLAELTDKNNVTLISDELYRGFCYDRPFTSAALFSRNAIILDGFSKTHAMTGWRVGYMHGPSEIIDACITLQQYTFVCSPQVGQWAAIAAADCDMSWAFDTCRKKRDRLVEGLRGHYDFINPGGAFYLYPKAPGGSATMFAEHAVEQEQLLVVPGTVFGRADTHFRISYTVTDQMLERGIKALIRLAKKR
jgi:aspartate aminotransferase/aminotransferase